MAHSAALQPAARSSARSLPACGASCPRAAETDPVSEVWQTLALQTATVRPKLELSNPDDPEEREANRVASSLAGSMEHVQGGRTCSCGGECPRCRSAKGGLTVPAPLVQDGVASPGRPLDAATRAYYEPRLGSDLGGVRLHTGAQASQSARSIGALAYTYGRDMVLNSSRVTIGTPPGDSVLAHELVHAVRHNHAHPERVHRIPDEDGVQGSPPRYAYSTNCGWIDWAHSNPGMARQLIDGVQEASDRLTASGSSDLERIDAPRMEAGIPHVGVLLSGVTPIAHLKRPLSTDEVLAVALRIFMMQSLAFETLQSWTEALGSSSFSEEDLPSNMIGFYRAARGFDRAHIETTCDAWDAARSLAQLQGHTFQKTGGFRPLTLPPGGRWPADLSSITPAVAGGPLMDVPDALFETTTTSFQRGLLGYQVIMDPALSIENLSGTSPIDISGTTPGSAHGPHFNVRPLPSGHGLICRWVIQGPLDSRIKMKGDDESDVFGFGPQFNVYINAPSRELLRNGGVANATILCRVRVGGEGERAAMERLLELPVEFTW